MAINVKNEEGKIVIEIDNGHATSLKKIVQDYNLKGEAEALNFMLAILTTAEGKEVKINDNSYLPSDTLKKPQDTTEPQKK